MVVEEDLPIGSEEGRKVDIDERMRVRAFWSKDHEVGDIDDTHTKLGNFLAQDRCRCDDFESELDTDTNEDTANLR